MNLNHFINQGGVENLVNIAVCGKFHFCNYIPLLRPSILSAFYCSARIKNIKNFPDDLQSKTVNLFLKEYFYHFHCRYLGRYKLDHISSFYHDLWQVQALMAWKSAPIFHFMIHGTCVKLLERAKSEGSIIVGEPVNASPPVITKVMQKEYDLLGIKPIPPIFAKHVYERMMEELEYCDYLLSPSRSVSSSFASLDFPQCKIKTLNYGVNLNLFHDSNDASTSCDSSVYRVICVGSVSPRKGHYYLLEAWKRLQLPNSELLFVGAIDPLMNDLLSKYSGLYRHIGHINHANLPDYYRDSSVFVLCSVEDGFATVVTEAMACGLPVIVSDSVGSSDLITNNCSGFVIPPRSLDRIMEVLELLYLDRELCKSMGREARRAVASSGSWHDYASSLSTMYMTLIDDYS